MRLFCDRQMKVSIVGQDSDWLSPNGGVPQGTKLGDLLFIILINDLNPPVPTAKFVDDTTIHECFSDPNDSSLQVATDAILTWSSNNEMQLNAAKTKEMLISFKRQNEPIPNIKIDGHQIERVTEAKLLGVNISSNLSWNTHIDSISIKASQRTFKTLPLKTFGTRSTRNHCCLYVNYKAPVRVCVSGLAHLFDHGTV